MRRILLFIFYSFVQRRDGENRRGPEAEAERGVGGERCGQHQPDRGQKGEEEKEEGQEGEGGRGGGHHRQLRHGLHHGCKLLNCTLF
jgi:hypothetical protein